MAISVDDDSKYIGEYNNEVRPFPKFHTINLNGEIVTDEIFIGKMTIFYIWTTKADHCQELLEELSTLSDNISSDVQIIGLVGDLKENIDDDKVLFAKEISSRYSKIQQLMVNDDFYELLSHVKSVPTTCFVDSNGNLIGQAVFGPDIKLIQKEFERLTEADSQRINSLQIIQKSIFNDI